jgi:hypothetical protein
MRRNLLNRAISSRCRPGTYREWVKPARGGTRERRRPQSWCCEVQGGTTIIWANFGTADPIRHLSEINVRASLFMPA